MKKIILASVCGLCMLAACAFTSVTEKPAVAIGGAYLQGIH